MRIDLEFDSAAEADAFRTKLRELWGSGRAAPALGGAPRATIVEAVLSEEYGAG